MGRGDAYMDRALLMRAVVNRGRPPEHPPFVSIGYPAELMPFLGMPARRVAPVHTSSWEHVRARGPPSRRRAALWIIARYVIPAPQKPRLSEGLPAEAFAALDAQWEAPFLVKELKRVQRYRGALRCMTRAFEEERNGQHSGRATMLQCVAR